MFSESAGQDASPLQRLDEVVDSALAEGVAEADLRVDLGLTRDIAYYTGMVFDVMAGRSDGWRRWSL